TSLPNEGGATCKTEKYEMHTQAGCVNCHGMMDGIGFGLETYDATGKFRQYESDDPMTTDVDESQCALATDGKLVFGKEEAAFSGPGELGTLLAERGEVSACLMRQFYRFAVGRSKLDAVDEQLVEAMVTRLASGDVRFDDVVLDLASSEAFLLRRLEE